MSDSSGYPRLRWLAFSLVFFALPLLLVCYWFGRMWDDRTETRLNREFRRLEVTLDSVTRWQTSEAFFERLLQRFATGFIDWPRSRKLVRRQLASIKSRFPGSLEFVFLDHQGAVIPELSDFMPPKAVVRRFWTDLQKFYAGDHGPMKASWNMYRNLFGPFLRLDKDFSSFTITTAFFEKRHSQVLFSRPYTSGMFFVFFNHSPAWETLSVRDEVIRFNRKEGVNPIALLDLADWSQRSIIPGAFDDQELRSLLLQFDKDPRKFVRYGDRWWFQKVVTPTTRLFTSFPITEDADVTRERLGVVGTLLLSFTVLSWFSLRFMLGRATFFFSLRYKLLLLFLFIVGLPLLIMGITAGGYLEELRGRLESKVFSDTEDALRVYDRNLPLVLGIVQNTILKRVFTPCPPETGKLQPYLESLVPFCRKFQVGHLVLYDGDGNLSIPPEIDLGRDEKGLKVVKPVYVGILKSLQSSARTEFSDVKETGTAQMLTAAMGLDLETLFAEVGKNLGQLRIMEFGSKKAVQGVFPVFDTTGFPRYLALVSWSHPAIQRVYNERYIPRLEKKLPETGLYCLSLESAKEKEQHNRREFPQRFRHFDLIRPLFGMIDSSGKTLHLRRTFRGKTYFITVFKGEDLYQYYLIAVTSDRLINQEIERVKGNFRLVSFGLLLMALTVGNLVARKFLEPIAHLSSGVKAIKEKEFDTRIPIVDQDELGDLSDTFNQMIESLHEVSLGKQVQEQLFPAGKVVLGEYQVRGVSRTATGLGGDYFEYLAINDRYLLVLLGDATGHGIPAALVMAMAKAVVLQCSQQPTTDGRQIIETLNRIIFLGMARKRLMTAACLWIDTERHTIDFWNGGHPYPIKRSSDGRFSMIEASGAPLGIRTKIALSPGQASLEAGERIILYTDGLIESIPDEPPRTNFDLFMDYLGTRPLLPIEQACEDILDNHCHTLTGQALPDDFTIVILERVSKA